MSARSTQIQPVGSGAALTTASSQAIGPNPSRRGLILHNPHATISIYVAPANVTTAPGGAGWLLIFPGGDRMFDGLPATCAWNAAMASSTGNISTLEWVA